MDELMKRGAEIFEKIVQKLKSMPDLLFHIKDGLLPGIHIAELRQVEEKIMVKQ